MLEIIQYVRNYYILLKKDQSKGNESVSCGRGGVVLLNKPDGDNTERVSLQLRLEGGRGTGYADLGQKDDFRQRE